MKCRDKVCQFQEINSIVLDMISLNMITLPMRHITYLCVVNYDPQKKIQQTIIHNPDFEYELY